MAGNSFLSASAWGRRENEAMAVTARKYNPGFLTDDELMASFCVRTAEFETMVEVLRECTGASNPHQIVIGPRGSGKTSLLLRIAAEVRRDAGLAAGLFPVVFAEESYEVSTAGELWLECLSQLAGQAPRHEEEPDLRRTFEELRAIRADRALADRCLGALLDFSDREGRRLVLMVENLDMMFRDMADADAGWRLRKVLQTEPRIVLLASATSRFDEIDDRKHALYDLFSVRTLRPLDTGECATLWEAVAGQCPRPGTIRSLEILTGGSPRLLAIVARFGAELSFRKLMANLLDLIDDHTEYFKSHLEALPAQERRVYLALAALWKPATTREIAGQARLDTSKCSAQLTRLAERGAVQSAGGSARRKQYYLTERLYNIYYLLRRSRTSDRLVEALIHFMESFYSPTELMDISTRIIREAESFSTEMRSLSQAAFVRLMELPALARHREDLLAMTPGRFVDSRITAEFSPSVSVSDSVIVPDGDSAPPEGAGMVAARRAPDDGREDRPCESMDEETEQATKDILDRAVALLNRNQPEEALAACDEVMRRLAEKDVPIAHEWQAKSLVIKGAILARVNRPQDALAVSDEVVRRFGQSENPNLLGAAANAIFNKGVVLAEIGRPRDALVTWEEVARRFGKSEHSAMLEALVKSLVNRASTLVTMNRPQEALQICDAVLDRFEQSEISAVLESVVTAFTIKGATLVALNQPQDALDVWEELVGRFGQNENPAFIGPIAMALADKAWVLTAMNRPQDALEACDEVLRRFGQSEIPATHEPVAIALINKGNALVSMNRHQDALDVCDEVLGRFGQSEIPVVCQLVAMALATKGSSLEAMNRPQEALVAWEELVDRLGQSEDQADPHLFEMNLVKGLSLAALNQPQDALNACDDALRIIGEGEVPAFRELTALAFAIKGKVLGNLNRTEDTLAAYEEMSRRLGEDELPALSAPIEDALLEKAEIELKCRRFEAAADTAGRMLDRDRTGSPENRSRAHLIRAVAALAGTDMPEPVRAQREGECEREVKAALALLPETEPLPKKILGMMMLFGVFLGAVRMCELIRGSPSADILLPLTTALELELGLDPRVALEVKEVAEDIRRELAKLRETGAGALEKLMSGADTGAGRPDD